MVRSPSALLLLSLLLVPSMALAVPGTLGPSSLPGLAPRASLRLLEDPGTEGEGVSERTRPHGATRVLGEVGAGVLTGLGGGLAGLFLGFIPCKNFFSSRCDAPTVGFMLGGGVGMALGVFWGGNVLGGEGAFLQGALPGMAVGLVGAALLGLIPTVGLNGAAGFSLPLGLLGAIVGYELTHASALRRSLQPTLSLTPRGASLGLAGAF